MWILIPVGLLGAVIGWRQVKKSKERKQLASRVVVLSAKYTARKTSDLERVELHDAARAIGLDAIAMAVKTKKKLPQDAVDAARKLAA